MKKLLTVFLCMSLLFPTVTVLANDEIGETYHDYCEEESENIPEPAYNHFATATIEDLHTYDGYQYANNEHDMPAEVECFDPPQPPPVVPPPRYTSAAVVILDADTGIVLYGSEHNTQHYPASITKIMTALIVLDHITDLDERVEFSSNAIFSIPRNSSHIAMDVGETLTVYQALYGLMLSSANEVSIALAEHVAGSVHEFANLMNHRAQGLGAVNTYFVNPSGLPATGHVTTAYDMALIMREAINHPVFVDIISTRRFDIPPTERQDYTRELLNTNRLIHPGSYFNEWVIGSKTGWTTDAMHTLVTYAEKDGRRLIISAIRGETSGPYRDTLALMSYGFSMPFEERLVFESATYTRMVPVYQDINGEPLNIGYVTLRADNDLHFMLPMDFDNGDLKYNLYIPTKLQPPVEVGDILGRVSVYVQNVSAGYVNLYAQNLVLALPAPPPEDDEEPGAGGSDSNIGLTTNTLPAAGYYPLAAYPTANWWADEYFTPVLLPIIILGVSFILAVTLLATSRRRRMRRLLRNRVVKYSQAYRYR